MFEPEQQLLPFNPSRIAAERTTCPHDAVAGHDDRHRIATRARCRRRAAAGAPGPFGDLSVRRHLSVRDARGAPRTRRANGVHERPVERRGRTRGVGRRSTRRARARRHRARPAARGCAGRARGESFDDSVDAVVPVLVREADEPARGRRATTRPRRRVEHGVGGRPPALRPRRSALRPLRRPTGRCGVRAAPVIGRPPSCRRVLRPSRCAWRDASSRAPEGRGRLGVREVTGEPQGEDRPLAAGRLRTRVPVRSASSARDVEASRRSGTSSTGRGRRAPARW